ncbi:MAG: efflux RND transporter periplasmic adaptor subunit, partial [Bacteroidales bacterium]|nr:efflux RND transporter periplasmic adaptor subunit [Bacteroidales bacterium]
AEGSIVEAGDTICILEAPDLLTYYDRFAEELEKVQINLVKEEANNAVQVSMLQAQLEENKARMLISQLDSVQLQFAPPVQRKILQLEQQKRLIQEDKITKKLSSQKIINEQTIRALKSQIIQKEQMVNQFQNQLDQLNVITPKAGMLVYAESPYVRTILANGGSLAFGGNLKVGSTVRRRQALFHVPDLTKMQVVLMVPEGDFKRIEKGQKVLIRPESVHGLEKTGEVTIVSLFGEKPDRKSQLKSYKITVKVDSTDSRIMPGLSATCEIIINHVHDTIVAPTMAIHKKDSSKVIYVAKGELFTPLVIKTGLSNSSESIISEGLLGDETISLMKPPLNSIEPEKNHIK